MGVATPIQIPILDERAVTPDGNRTARAASRSIAANNNDVPTKRPLKRSPSHIALVIESLADAKTEPSSGPESVPGQASLGKTTLRLVAVAALMAVVAIIVSLPGTPNAVAGLSIRELASIEVPLALQQRGGNADHEQVIGVGEEPDARHQECAPAQALLRRRHGRSGRGLGHGRSCLSPAGPLAATAGQACSH